MGFVVLIYFAKSDLFQALCILRHKCSEDVFKLDFGIERTAASSMALSFRFEVIS